MLKFPSNNRLALGSLTVITASLLLIVTPALAQTIITLFLIGFHTNLSLESMIGLLSNLWWINLIPKAIGLTVLVAVVCRSKLRIDSSKVKRQLTKASVLGILGLFLVGAIYVEVPIAKAETVATTGYILDTPLPIADWYVGKYSNNNYFAINGSNWDNLMAGVGSTAWASYTGNYTLVEQYVLGNITSGQVYLKEVPFNYNLTIPANVKVIENLNGMTREFVSASSTQGSPYTISIDKVNTQYYMVQDGANRYVNSWSSTNYTSTYSSALASLTTGGRIYQTKGTFNLAGTIYVVSKDNITLSFEHGSQINVPNSMNTPAFIVYTSNNVLIQQPQINGNAPNQVVTNAAIYGSTNLGYPSGIAVASSSNVKVTDAIISNCRVYGYVTMALSGASAINNGIEDSKITFCGWNGITLGGSGGNEQSNYAIHNEVAYSGDVGISALGGYNSLITKNYIHDMNGTIGSNNTQWAIGGELGGQNFITFNTIKNAQVGIDITTGDFTTISQNTIQGVTASASGSIAVTANNVQVFSNTILQTPAWTFSITITGNANSIYSNMINSTVANACGIYIASGSNNQIYGNNLQGMTGYTIFDGGTSNQISDPTMNLINLGNLGVLNGQIETVVVNQATGVGQVLYESSSGTYSLASATSTSTMNQNIAIAIQAVGSSGNCLVMTRGYLRNDALATMTFGNTLYISTTAGNITTTAPSGSGNMIKDVGQVEAAHIIKFYDNGAWGTHV
jgi:hypothetical protein